MSAASTSVVPGADRRQKRRHEIVTAAAHIFADAGYDDTEMERVAQAVNVAKGTIYLYFSSKQELFFACVDEGMREMQVAVSVARDSTQKPFERIARAVRAYLEFFDAHSHFVELLIQERAIFKNRKRPTYFEYRDATRETWRDFYRELIASGLIRSDLPLDGMLDMIGNSLYGTMFTNHFAGRSTSLDEQYEVLLKVIYQGVCTDSARKDWERVIRQAREHATPATAPGKRRGKK